MSEPRVFEEVEPFRSACESVRAANGVLGFVPTMGALHDGHLALVSEAKKKANVVAVSIFVNPTQFGPNEDFSRYPRDLAGDVRKLATVGADFVFFPSAETMYPKGEQTRVRVGALADALCGPFRPGHFEGVATIVTKLFAHTGSCISVFGKKDYQQLAILRRVALDLFLPITLVGFPIVRERDGLAMSSRNAYLSPEERARALSLSAGLRAAYDAFAAGERDAKKLQSIARTLVEPGATSIDYVSVVDAESLETISKVSDRALLAIACRVGKTRLIDNLVLGEDPPPS